MSELITEKDWAAIDGRICRVVDFTPLARVVAGNVVGKRWFKPYASVTLECAGLAPDAVGRIMHKLDFLHLWAACVDSPLTVAEEVDIVWAKSRLSGAAQLLSRFLPGLAVMICKAGAYELITDPLCRPDLVGEARLEAERPIARLVPVVLA